MTSGRSGLRLPWPDDGRFASWCGSCAKARISLGIWVSEFGPPRPFGRVSMCRPAHRSIRCRSRWAQGTCLLPSMTITPWCSPIKRPGLLGRETGAGKFVTRVEVMLNSAAIARPLRVSEMYRDPRRVGRCRTKVVQFPDRVRDQNANPTSPLNRYIEG